MSDSEDEGLKKLMEALQEDSNQQMDGELAGIGSAEGIPDEIKAKLFRQEIDFCTRAPEACGGEWIWGRVDSPDDRKRFIDEMSRARNALMQHSKYWTVHAALVNVAEAWMKAGAEFRKAGDERSVGQCIKHLVPVFAGINYVMHRMQEQEGVPNLMSLMLPPCSNLIN